MHDASAPEVQRRIPKLQVRNPIQGPSPDLGLAHPSDDISTIRSPSDPRIKIPKLQVRNRIDRSPTQSDFASPTDEEITRVDSPTGPASFIAPSFSRPQISPTPSYGQAIPSSPVQSDYQSSRFSFVSRTSNVSPELASGNSKKSKSVFGFLSLREPSTTAWQQFVEEQQQQAALKGVKTVGLTQKKLPGNVPKVNSKWDGMPASYERSTSSLDIGSFVRNGSSILSRSASRKSGETTKPSTASSSKLSSKSYAQSKKSKKDASQSTSSTASTSASVTRRPSLSRPATVPRRISNDTVLEGPAMSIQSQSDEISTRTSSSENVYLPPTDAVSRLSLCFPPGYVPRDLVEDTTTAGAQEELIRDATPTPRAATADDQISEVPSMEDDSSQDHAFSQSDSTSQDSPLTPDLSVAIHPHRPDSSSDSQQETGSRQDFKIKDDLGAEKLPQWPLATKPEDVVPKHFRSVKEIPQWPLPTNAEDVIIEIPMSESTPTAVTVLPVPLESLNKSASSSLERLDFGTSEEETSQAAPPAATFTLQSSFTNPVPSVPFVFVSQPPVVSTSYSSTQSYQQQRISRSMYNPYSMRGPPAFQPGRVITKDSDLATIPESDTASIRSRNSVYVSGNSETKLERGDFGDPGSDRNSIAESTASSQMSAKWFLSPKERLGLGGFIKHSTPSAPWPLMGEEDKGFVVEGSVGQSPARGVNDYKNHASLGKRTTLLGVFKR